LNYEAQIKVINDGGKLFTMNDNHNAQIRAVNANDENNTTTFHAAPKGRYSIAVAR